MTGSVVSMDVAPPADMGASLPQKRTIIGAPSRVMISRIILASKAVVPSSVPLYLVMKILDNE